MVASGCVPFEPAACWPRVGRVLGCSHEACGPSEIGPVALTHFLAEQMQVSATAMPPLPGAPCGGFGGAERGGHRTAGAFPCLCLRLKVTLFRVNPLLVVLFFSQLLKQILGLSRRSWSLIWRDPTPNMEGSGVSNSWVLSDQGLFGASG